jgi:malonyl-CoA decarboxylase
MVNYLYRLGDIEDNHEAYSDRGEVRVSASVRAFLKS